MAKQKMTGKQLAQRIPLDYYKGRDGLGWWKLGLTALAPILAVGWWAAGQARGGKGRDWIGPTHGELAAVHAKLDAHCEACHVPGHPINNVGGPDVFGIHVAAKANCESCHAGPPHHENQIPAAKDLACASCHRDHRGRDVSLVRGPDGDCTRCHADLKSHTKGGAPSYADSITAFVEGKHPQVKAFQGDGPPKDPGKLKFNHKVHMTAGMDQGFTLEQIPDPERRERYASMADKGGVVRLDCASCHRLDAGDGGSAPASGAYMLPISYENQCRACHTLTYELKGDEGSPAVTVPHGLQPDKVYEFLRGRYAADFLDKNRAKFAPEQPASRLPGRVARDDPEAKAETAAARAEIEGKVNRAEHAYYDPPVKAAQSSLFADLHSCAECHSYEAKEGGALAIPEAGKPPAFAIARPDVPSVWYEHAAFDHSAHRAFDCRGCHEAAYPDASGDVMASEKSSDVLVPGIENCMQCHGPERAGPGGETRGGVRHDCAECHRYHNGDRPLQGPGSSARGARDGRSIEDWLKGAAGRPKPAPGT